MSKKQPAPELTPAEQAHQMGYEAYLRFRNLEHNPYKQGKEPELYQAWAEGWVAARNYYHPYYSPNFTGASSRPEPEPPLPPLPPPPDQPRLF